VPRYFVEGLTELTDVFARRPPWQQTPNDRRLRELRHLELTYDLPSFDSLAAWQRRAAELREHVLLSAGLWPLPERTPLNPAIFGRLERGDYSVEKVYFDSYPGFFVTGNLYRPLGRGGRSPGVLCPQGHWRPKGRLTNNELVSTPSRCITLARQGYVAFSWDMVGFLDNIQIPHYYAGPAEALWGISALGLQLWNSVRSVDFLASLDDVDPERLGCTGESGGATQTFLLTAIDDRIKVSAPVNMVSAHYQGGCHCENAPNLRVSTNNVELAALMAPRPMVLVSATGDWTKNIPTVEYPAIRDVYRLFGAEDRVASVQVDAPHNYNLASREAVYAFFGKWLLEAPPGTDLHEQPLTVESDDDLRVFATHSRPSRALDERGLTAQLIQNAEAAVRRAWPSDEATLERFRETYEPLLRFVLGAEWPRDVSVKPLGQTGYPDFAAERFTLSRPDVGDELPAILFRPLDWTGGPAAVVVHGQGKAALVDAQRHGPGDLIRNLLSSGRAVLALDVFLTGEYHQPGGQNGRDQSANFFTCYNRTDPALRVQDVLTGLAYLRRRAENNRAVLIGIEDGGLWCLLARALAPTPPATIADAARFDSSADDSYLERLYLPSLRQTGGFPTALVLAAPAPTLVHNTGGVFNSGEVAKLFQSLGYPEALVTQTEPLAPREIVEWLETV
jgi:dienelactone hydrolase